MLETSISRFLERKIFALNLPISKFKHVSYGFFDFSSFALIGSISYSSHHPINAFSMIKTASKLIHTYKNMAAYEGRPLVLEVEREEDYYGHEEASSSGCGCGCFRVFSLKWWQGHEEEGKRLLEQNGEGVGGGEAWVKDKLKKVKEVSEVIAGPKWKTFIRKISGYGKKQQKNRFQYDEHSYALNFNSGAQSEEEDNMPPSFSARFSAPIPAGRRQNEL